MTKPNFLEHFEKTVSNAKERLKKLISEANKHKLHDFATGLATAVEILDEEEISPFSVTELQYLRGLVVADRLLNGYENCQAKIDKQVT